MTLDVRSIALQGVGFGSKSIALQGFAASETEVSKPQYPGGFASRPRRERKVDRLNDDDDVLMLFILN